MTVTNVASMLVLKYDYSVCGFWLTELPKPGSSRGSLRAAPGKPMQKVDIQRY
jgi:hypothetical protein